LSRCSRAAFERPYRADLVYQPDCYKLCGDAHCCGFARHERHFCVLGKRRLQELPLLPGQYAILSTRDLLAQFGEFERGASPYALGEGGAPWVDAIVGYRAGGRVRARDATGRLPPVSETRRTCSRNSSGCSRKSACSIIERCAPSCARSRSAACWGERFSLPGKPEAVAHPFAFGDARSDMELGA
jgi:hypothetical protein